MKKKELIQLFVALLLVVAVVATVIICLPHDAKSILMWYKDHLSYGIIILLMTIESSFIPFPSEIVIPPAAYFAVKSGDMSIAMIVLSATVGALLGAAINYVLSMVIGRPLVYGFANSKLGHMCLLEQEKVEKAEKYFDAHGAVSTFIGRLIPAIRQLISIPAGLAKMNFGVFALFTTLGAGIWNCVLAYLGYWLGQNFPEDQLFAQLEHYNRYLTWAGYSLLALVVLYIIYQGFFKKHKANN